MKKIIYALLIALALLFLTVDVIKYFSLANAVVKNDTSRVKLLLKLGANVNTEIGPNRITPLDMAVFDSHKEISELLISHGSDINHKDSSGNTALAIAVMFNRTELAKLLINKGAQLNDKLLFTAARNGNKEIVEIFINKGMSITPPCACCESPLLAATSRDNIEVAKFLVDRGAIIVNSKDRCYSPFHHAAANRAIQTINYFIEKGANINALDKDGHTPLYYATKTEDIEVQDILIRSGAIRK
jgi:ankyrin repeat protein